VDDATATFPVELTDNELELVRTSLQLLLNTLGHEESEELAEVQALLARLPDSGPPG
jgi:hypothetical protein